MRWVRHKPLNYNPEPIDTPICKPFEQKLSLFLTAPLLGVFLQNFDSFDAFQGWISQEDKAFKKFEAPYAENSK